MLFFFKQKMAYEWRISDWSSDVCSSDLAACTSSVSALLRSRQHLAPKDCVHASLIALALGFEPSKHIGVEPRRYLLLDRLIEPSTLGGLPEILCQRRGITIVATAIRHRLQGIPLGLLCLGQGGQLARIEQIAAARKSGV